MIDHAKQYFDEINTYEDIKVLVESRARENVYLDFKMLPYQKDLTPDEGKLKELISKAAGGFAHQEGGVIIWGIEAKDGTKGDCANRLVPINNLGQVTTLINRLSKDSISPRLNMNHEPIYKDDDINGDIGFIKSLFPRSDDLHVSQFAKKDFYQRFDDDLIAITTKAQMQALLNRNQVPILEISAFPEIGAHTTNSNGLKVPVSIGVHLSLKNIGQEVAEFPSVYLSPELPFSSIYDSSGNSNFPIGTFVSKAGGISTQFIPNAGFVIHPEQEINFGIMKFTCPAVPAIKYKCFAKNMEAKEGILRIETPLVV